MAGTEERSGARLCLPGMLLSFRRDPSVKLLVATTHLERDPQSTDRLITRGFQYGLLFRHMLAFAGVSASFLPSRLPTARRGAG